MRGISNFDPKPTKFPYPEQTDRHYLKVRKKKDILFDENYPYVDERKQFRFRQFLVRILLKTLVFPMTKIRLGLKVEGKQNLKKHKEEIKKGIISVGNHVHMWDYLAVLSAIGPSGSFILAWSQNVTGPSGTAVRLVGGIPIPDGGRGALRAFDRAVGKTVQNGGRLHVCAEGSMWEYYRPVRPFKKGFAHIAVKNDRPVLPMAFSYRKPNWIRRKLFRQIALLTLSVGEPLHADTNLAYAERITDLTVRTHDAVCNLAGIPPEKNIYAPVFHGDRKIEYR